MSVTTRLSLARELIAARRRFERTRDQLRGEIHLSFSPPDAPSPSRRATALAEWPAAPDEVRLDAVLHENSESRPFDPLRLIDLAGGGAAPEEVEDPPIRKRWLRLRVEDHVDATLSYAEAVYRYCCGAPDHPIEDVFRHFGEPVPARPVAMGEAGDPRERCARVVAEHLCGDALHRWWVDPCSETIGGLIAGLTEAHALGAHGASAADRVHRELDVLVGQGRVADDPR